MHAHHLTRLLLPSPSERARQTPCRRYGIPKVARKELVKQVTLFSMLAKEDKRVRMMATLIGVEAPECYSPKASHVVMRVLRKLFPGFNTVE